MIFYFIKKKTYNSELPFYISNSEGVCRRDMLV